MAKPRHAAFWQAATLEQEPEPALALRSAAETSFRVHVMSRTAIQEPLRESRWPNGHLVRLNNHVQPVRWPLGSRGGPGSGGRIG
jgi:hypothetical protein